MSSDKWGRHGHWWQCRAPARRGDISWRGALAGRSSPQTPDDAECGSVCFGSDDSTVVLAANHRSLVFQLRLFLMHQPPVVFGNRVLAAQRECESPSAKPPPSVGNDPRLTLRDRASSATVDRAVPGNDLGYPSAF